MIQAEGNIPKGDYGQLGCDLWADLDKEPSGEMLSTVQEIGQRGIERERQRDRGWGREGETERHRERERRRETGREGVGVDRMLGLSASSSLER